MNTEQLTLTDKETEEITKLISYWKNALKLVKGMGAEDIKHWRNKQFFLVFFNAGTEYDWSMNRNYQMNCSNPFIRTKAHHLAKINREIEWLEELIQEKD